MRIRPDNEGDPNQPRRTALGIAGLAAGTAVLTDGGWVSVEDIVEGDRVMTFEHGPQPVTSIRSRVFGADISTFWPNGILLVPAGALGPSEAFYLLPGQHVMLPSDLARAMTDDAAALVPAAALAGIRGICRVMPVDLLEVFELRLPREAAVELEGGTWARCPGISARARSTPLRRRRVYSQAGAA